MVVKYSSAVDENARSTEGEYKRLARQNPASVFLRSFSEYDQANLLMGQAQVNAWPTFDIYYRENRVARIEGNDHVKVQEVLDRYQLQNSSLDLFSEASPNPYDSSRIDFTKTPRTSNRFIPGYDWSSKQGFFDETAEKFESDYGNWLPNTEDN